MLKQGGRTTFFLRLGGWMFTCLPRKGMDNEARKLIRPFNLGWLACWCDRNSDGSEEMAA